MSMSMALRRDKGSGTIYFNNITQKWFASCPIGVYVNGRTKYKTFTGDTEAEARKKMKSFQREQSEVPSDSKSKWTLQKYMEYWLETYKKIEVKTSTYSRCVRSLSEQVIDKTVRQQHVW